MSEIVSVEKLSKNFGDKQVINEISIHIPQGEIFGLLGPSGAGKTTLIKALTGQIPYIGNARIMGCECYGMNRKVYKSIGMVLDNCGLYERLSCYDNLLLYARLYNVERMEIKKVLTRLGMEEAMNRSVKNLSKGMKQRLLLARAILNKPKLVFLDEPTSGLDPKITEEIHNMLFELKKEGVTIFLTTHNMEEAHKVCDKIALLNDGKIVEYGEPNAICRKYNRENKITILCKDESTVTLDNNSSSSKQIEKLFREELVNAIHSSEPNLETVFITLTGRGLE